MSDLSADMTFLRSPQTIRTRAKKMLLAAENDKVEFWRYNDDRLEDAVARVEKITTENYPDGNIPYHSRWRHIDDVRVAKLKELTEGMPPDDVLYATAGAVMVSVLLDAGAGMTWRYKDPYSGDLVGRSEGLCRASIDWFLAGGLASDRSSPRADADQLEDVTKSELLTAFQVTTENPLVGVDGRLDLLHKLGATIKAKPRHFAGTHRLGGFCEYAVKEGTAIGVMEKVLDTFADIWPGRFRMEGVNLGDTWKHPLFDDETQAPGFIPFHKLSQWLTYSLVETSERAGTTLEGVEELTGLPEYRNGGLFFDTGVLQLRDENNAHKTWQAGDRLIVEWRALTVALLDRLADRVRDIRGVDAASLPLAKVLQGGTWTAGRQIAAEKRSDGGSPLILKSDGTVF